MKNEEPKRCSKGDEPKTKSNVYLLGHVDSEAVEQYNWVDHGYLCEGVAEEPSR